MPLIPETTFTNKPNFFFQVTPHVVMKDIWVTYKNHINGWFHLVSVAKIANEPVTTT